MVLSCTEKKEIEKAFDSDFVVVMIYENNLEFQKKLDLFLLVGGLIFLITFI